MSGARRSRDWQKTDPHLRRHPMFARFKATLGVSTTEAHGILSGIWAFAFDFAHDGDLSRFTPEDIALAIEWDGDPDDLWSALSIGFLENGTLHHWHEWGGALFFTRKTDAERKWDTRNSDKQGKVSGDVHGRPGTRRDNAPEKKREEKRREDQEKEQKQEPSRKSASADFTSSFEKWWAAYGRYGSKVDAMDCYVHWRKKRASESDLLKAAAAYVKHCEKTDTTIKHASTFLAKRLNRWSEWISETHGNPNGKGKVEVAKKPACPVCETDLTFDERQRPWCPMCERNPLDVAPQMKTVDDAVKEIAS